MQKGYKEGSEERKKIDREVYRLRNELMDESYQRSLDWIEEEKYYNRMSLAEELAANKRLQRMYKDDAEKRRKADREVYRLEKEIYEAQQQYISDVQNAQAEASQQRLDLEQEYADKVQEINDRLAQDIQSLNDEYENAVKSRADALYDAYGLFDEVTKKEEVSGEKLMSNLEDQVQEFGQWQDILDKLSARGLDGELIGELQEMGPSAIAEIKALNSMTDSELEKYAALWSIKHAQARAQATSELEGLRVETQDEIAQLRADADQELSEYQAVWRERMDQVTLDANEELEQLRQDFAEKVGLIKTDTDAEMAEMSESAQKILREAGWSETGEQIVAGITAGVQSRRSSFIDELTKMALAGVEAVKDTLEIQSPSRVFRELGGYVGQGFVDGLRSYADRTYEAGSDMADATRNGLSDALSSVSQLIENGLDTEPTIRPVLDLTDVTRGAGELDGLFQPRRSIVLAGQAGSAFEAKADRSGAAVSTGNGDVVDAIRSLQADVSALGGTIRKIQVVLDTGALVGGLTEPMDSALGRRAIYRGRGI